MNSSSQYRHVIDLVFPITLLFVFAASALMVLILSAHIYGTTTHRFQTNAEKYGALNYISEKLRQNDIYGGIHIEELDGVACLALDSEYHDQAYTTYIYAQDGYLRELFARSDIPITLHSGQSIMTLASLSIEHIDDQLIRITVTDEDGRTESLITQERSMP